MYFLKGGSVDFTLPSQNPTMALQLFQNSVQVPLPSTADSDTHIPSPKLHPQHTIQKSDSVLSTRDHSVSSLPRAILFLPGIPARTPPRPPATSSLPHTPSLNSKLFYGAVAFPSGKNCLPPLASPASSMTSVLLSKRVLCTKCLFLPPKLRSP